MDAKKLIFLAFIVVVLYAVFHHSEPTAPSTPVSDGPVSDPETFEGCDCTGTLATGPILGLAEGARPS